MVTLIFGYMSNPIYVFSSLKKFYDCIFITIDCFAKNHGTRAKLPSKSWG